VARRSFKSDISFLQKISMGAVGTRRVFESLQAQGHQPLELERGSRSFKIWKKIKVKRIRVPDILCVRCGTRVESRAKKDKFNISMSHSKADPERGWDHGLNDGDYAAVVIVEQSGEAPIDWNALELVQYVKVEDLRKAKRAKKVVEEQPKGAEEGYEIRIVWPAVATQSNGQVIATPPDRIQVKRDDDGRVLSYSLKRKGIQMKPLVQRGDPVTRQQALAAVVPVVSQFPCGPPVTGRTYVKLLASSSLSERYAAAKALSLFDSDATRRGLRRMLADGDENILVQLEAAASLARLGDGEAWDFIARCLQNEYLAYRLEAVIILAELPFDQSCATLCCVLQDPNQDSEIRAGAAWSLGELRNEAALKTLITSFGAMEEEIRIEAARGLAKLTERFTPAIIEAFPRADSALRPGIAWALSRSRHLSVDSLLDSLVDEDARHWVAYVLGMQDPQQYIQEIEKLKERDPEVYFAVTVLWKIVTSWVYGLEEYG
jgi:HEAT repeat protein